MKMKTLYFLSSVVCCLWCFTSCQNGQNKIPVVGELDTAAIAIDTIMQKGFESSYEFHKTLTVNPNLVYDVVAYGGPASKGEYAIMRRGADNKSDTVQKGNRDGIIADAFLADSNKNNKPEVYVVIQDPRNTSVNKVLKYEN